MFDSLVAALPLAEGGEEAQLKRIAELQGSTFEFERKRNRPERYDQLKLDTKELEDINLVQAPTALQGTSKVTVSRAEDNRMEE